MPFRSSSVFRSWALRALLLGLVLVGWGCAAGGPPPAPTPWRDLPPEQAEPMIRAELARNPRDAEAHLDLARILGDRGDATEASEHLAWVRALEPKRVDEMDRIARHYLERYQQQAADSLAAGAFAGAKAALDRSEAMVPNDPRTSLLRGKLFSSEGDLDAALMAFRTAWMLKPEDTETRDTLLGALLADAQKRYEAEDFQGAWEEVEEAVQIQDSPDLEYLRGLVAYAQARRAPDMDKPAYLSLAEKAFRTVLNHSPDDEDASFNLGAVLLASEQYTEAARIYWSLIDKHPRDGRLYLALSHVHSMNGDSEAAVAEEAIGKALRAGQPVEDPLGWADRAGERFPESDLATVLAADGAPEAIYTYTVPGGGLVEVWFYDRQGLVDVFREGGRLGTTIEIQR